MKKLFSALPFVMVLFLQSYDVSAQNSNTSYSVRAKIFSRDSITRDNYTLIFISRDSAFDKRTKEKMISAFFTVYPKLIDRFNKSAIKKVVFVIDPAYGGPAGTSNGIVTYGADWMRNRPDDIDVVTHEVMHIVQAYPSDSCPGWLTEGIADYARYKYGVDNAGGGWALTLFDPNQSYKNSYRIAARFLTWLENNIRSTIINELDAAMRAKKYTADTWKTLTGKTVDELWQAYSQKPAL